jgi:hypothetical protein
MSLVDSLSIISKNTIAEVNYEYLALLGNRVCNLRIKRTMPEIRQINYTGGSKNEIACL